jgi:type IV secretory pathway TrbD component
LRRPPEDCFRTSGEKTATRYSIALLLLLFAEFGFVLWLRGLTIRDYFASRNPVAETVYYVMLAVFAAMPLLLR